MWPQRENKGWGNVLIDGFVFNIGCCCWNKQSKCIMMYFPSLFQIALFKRFTLQTLYPPNIWKTVHLIKHMDKISRSKILENWVSNFIFLEENWATWWLITYNNSTSQHNFAAAGGGSQQALRFKYLSIMIIGSRAISDTHQKCYGWIEYIFAFVDCCFREISIAASFTPSNAVLWSKGTLTLTQVALIEWKICLH